MARILIIEDNPDNLELMSYLLENFGHQVLSAGDGRTEIASTLAHRPDLVVCDIQMQVADGYTVAHALKSDPRLAGIPLVAVTALAMVGDRARILAAGFDTYISKPIDPQRFVADLENLLHGDQRVDAPAASDQVHAQYAPAPVARASILVVDDIASNQELMRDTLEPFGFEVRLADCMVTALAMALERLPDLVVSDLHMPDSDGFALVRRIKGDPLLQALPLILLSSSSWNDADRERAYAMGVNRFLRRPIEPTKLVDEIYACLRLR